MRRRRQTGGRVPRSVTFRLTTPLFDTRLYAQYLEAAYAQMYERHQANLPPEHIYLERS